MTQRKRNPRARLDELGEAARSARAECEGKDEGVSAVELRRLLEISQALHWKRDRDEILRFVQDHLRELFDAQNGFVVLFDENGEPVVQSTNLELRAADLPVSATLIERVRSKREPLQVDDLSADRDLCDRRSVERLRIASAMCAPLIVEGEVIGVLQFDQRGDPHPFPRNDLRLLGLFADMVATALYNQRLIERLNRSLAETRAAQERLLHAERLSALGEMAAGIAHNFNNTLFVAQGMCDVLLAKASLAGADRTALEGVRTCVQDAAGMLRRLQVFTGNAEEEEERSAQVGEVLAEIRELTRAKWQDEPAERGLELCLVTVDEGTPPVAIPPQLLREVLTNLVFNAVEATAKSGSIELRAAADGDVVRISVRDEGSGITPEVRKKLFEPFFSTKGARGHGLGLSTSWSIVDRLGGRIEVESEPGRGSTFTVVLPRVAPRPQRPAPSDAVRRARGRILVVDDDPVVLETICQLVHLLGHQASAFTSPARALEVFRAGAFDAVLTDLGMPGMSGSDLAHEVQRLRPGTPVLMLTGWGADVDLGADVPVDEVIAKPVTLEVLGEALERALAARA